MKFKRLSAWVGLLCCVSLAPWAQADSSLSRTLFDIGDLSLGGESAQAGSPEGQPRVSPQRLRLLAKLAQAERRTFVQQFKQARVSGSKTSIVVQGKHPYSLYLHEFEGIPVSWP